jgi:eukaryotic-like serine/threonine-protein kinase
MIGIDFFNAIFQFNGFSFLIDSKIIESGQRTVYLGHKVEDGEPVVAKALLYNEVRIGRIQREIGILEAINSPYFPRFYCKAFISKEIIENYIDNLDKKSDNVEIEYLKAHFPRPFFVTCEEYVDNIKWDEFSRQLQNEVMLIDFICHLFKALDLLWTNKIVHRDIKPDNVLIRPDLQPVVIDLGIAKSLREGTAVLTLPGYAPCTPQYAAPEQLQISADITHKVDQFSVGVILYHLLTGTYPYGKYDDIDVEGLLANFNKNDLRPLTESNPSVTAGLAVFVHRLLEVEPYKRFRNTSAILSALDEIRRIHYADPAPGRPQFSLEQR